MTQDTTPTERALTAEDETALRQAHALYVHRTQVPRCLICALFATLDAERAARAPEAKDATIERLTQALRVATHSPHDQLGEPNEGFPVCSVCGAIQTRAARAEPGLREAAERVVHECAFSRLGRATLYPSEAALMSLRAALEAH